MSVPNAPAPMQGDPGARCTSRRSRSQSPGSPNTQFEKPGDEASKPANPALKRTLPKPVMSVAFAQTIVPSTRARPPVRISRPMVLPTTTESSRTTS